MVSQATIKLTSLCLSGPSLSLRSSRGIHVTCANLKRRKWMYYRYAMKLDKGKDFPFTYTTRKEEERGHPAKETLLPTDLQELRFKYPEFLPNNNPERRHKISTQLEREDMIRRRRIIDIPEFYVGSIMAVTISDPNAPGKVSRFVGICILREGVGLRAAFTLRNVVDREGIEIRYDMYNPTIRNIEVLKLEKRLDEDLTYLRDAEPQYSTFPMDMEPEMRKEGEPVPLNPIKVKMLPFPWTKKWYSKKLESKTKGIESFDNILKHKYEKTTRETNPYEKFDLMKEYREHIPEDQQIPIWQQVKIYEDSVSEERKKARRAKLIKR